MIKEFKEFILRGNVIDLAVAVVIGTAFAAVVKAFTDNILMPLIGILGGKKNFDDLMVYDLNGSLIKVGSFISAVVNFVIIAFALFLIVKAINKLQNRRRREGQVTETEELKLTELDLLKEIRDLLAAERS